MFNKNRVFCNTLFRVGLFNLVFLSTFIIATADTTPVSAYSATITTASDVVLNISPVGDGTGIHAESINVSSTCRAGYNLSIATPTGSDLYLENNGTLDSTASFTAVDGTSALNSTNNTNKWGYTLTENPTSSTVFTPLSPTASILRTTSQTASPSSDINDTFNINFGVKVDDTVTPGNYKMANNGTIVYYLTMAESCNVVDIAYDGNNADAGTMGAVGTGVIHTGVKGGDTVSLIASNFSRTGYGFAGWSFDKDAGTKLLDNDNTNNPVVYGPQEDITLPSDILTYDTDNDGIVKLYAVWLQSQGDLQGWMGCNNLDTATYDSTTGKLDLTKNSVTALTDMRDHDTYAVARLADGKCWMIENLRLDADATRGNNQYDPTVTNEWLAQGYGKSTTYGNFAGLADAESTNFSNTTTANSLYYSGTQSGTASMNIGTSNYPGYRMPRYNNINTSTRASSPTSNGEAMYSYGNYYTWSAAIANLTYNSTNNRSTTNTSLCPTGWHLPTGGSVTTSVNVTETPSTWREFYNLGWGIMGSVANDSSAGTNAYYNNTTTNAAGKTATATFRSFPNNFLYSGYFYISATGNRSIIGNYWSSTAYSGTSSYQLYLSSSNVYPGTRSSVTHNGYSIRCTASDPVSYTLSYDANGGSGTLVSQSITANGAAEFTISSAAPTRSGYTFAGWTDDKGNEVQPGSAFKTKDTNTIFYAIWTNNSCNPTATTIGTGNTTTDAVCLQDVTPSMKASLPIADSTTGTYTLIDARDNQSYTIAKLPDGELWMTKNLNYSSTTLNTSHDTDIPSGVFRLPESTTTSSTNNTAVTIRTTNNSSNNNNGTYYSWPAAIASTNSYDSGNITSSICPKGWDLPIDSHFTNLKTKADYKTGNLTTSAPSSFLINGGFTNGASFYDTSYSHFWTSTSNSSTAAYGARVNGTTMTTSSSTGTTYGGNKYYRKNIRCIASNGIATINYNANGGTGTMMNQVNEEINRGATISSNSFTAPANSQFRNWNTSPDGTGTTVTAGTLLSSIASNGDTITLYAQWDELYYIAFNANESSVGESSGSATGTMTNQTVKRDTATAIKTNTFALTGYIFVGWNTVADGTGTFYGDGRMVTNLTQTGNTITLYAVWKNGALLDTGQNVNQKLKRLAGNSSATYDTQDGTITALIRSDTLPSGFTPSTENTISASTSPLPIYAWYDSSNTTIYYYSEAANILMNKDSSHLFYYMQALSNLSTISTWDTIKVTNMYELFWRTGNDATNFTLDLSSWNTSSVKNMGRMFTYAGLNATTWSVGDLSSWDTSSATNMNGMFGNAGNNATTWSVGDLSSWDTSSVTHMESMFTLAGRNSTTWSVGDLSSWDTSSVTNMSNMFSDAGRSATTWSVGDLSSWDISRVTNLSQMFLNAGYSAASFTLDLSSWDTSSVTNMSNMFSDAGRSATAWSVGDISSWDTSGVTNMYGMFSRAGYSATTWSVGNLSSWNTSSVTNMSYMFSNTGNNATAYDISYISSWDTSNVLDMSYMFSNTGNNATNFTLDLSSWNTSSVTNMSDMFFSAGHNAITFNLNLSSWDTSNVTSVARMFDAAGHNATTWSITIPKTNDGTATGPISNTTSRIYGNSTSVSTVPPDDRFFTLAD